MLLRKRRFFEEEAIGGWQNTKAYPYQMDTFQHMRIEYCRSQLQRRNIPEESHIQRIQKENALIPPRKAAMARQASNKRAATPCLPSLTQLSLRQKLPLRPKVLSMIYPQNKLPDILKSRPKSIKLFRAKPQLPDDLHQFCDEDIFEGRL